MPFPVATFFNDDPNDMLDDSVGALTQSIFDATSSTQKTFVKLIPKVQQYQSQAGVFSNQLNMYQKSLMAALKSSGFHLKRGLMESTRMTNGISDAAAQKVIENLIGSMTKANAAIIKAIQKKDMLRFTLQAQPKILSAMARNIQSKTQKSYSIMSVADKIALNAKSVQQLSKNVVDKAERVHIAKASPALHDGVGKIQGILEIEKQIIPFQKISVKKILPKTIDEDLGNAYVATSEAIDHAENALTLSGSARAREIVDMRDQLRSALENQQDAVFTKTQISDAVINQKVKPFNLEIANVAVKKLIPSLKSYSENNKKIIEQIDGKGQVHNIMHRLEAQVAKQSSIFFPAYLAHVAERQVRYAQFF
jgi:hypothetical protein